DVAETLDGSRHVGGHPLAGDAVQRARFALAGDPERRSFRFHGRAYARASPGRDVADGLVGRGAQIGRAYERIRVVDVHAARPGRVARLDQRDRELAVGGLTRHEQVVFPADGEAYLDDGVRIACQFLRLQ